MTPLFTIDGIYRSPSNIAVVFADDRPEVNINPDHLERWLYKTDRLEVISDTTMRSDGMIQEGRTSKMTMEDYWGSEYVMQDLYEYLVVNCVDGFDIDWQKITSKILQNG